MDASKRSSYSQRPVGGRLTRKRVPLSCTACRMRKLKCNREKPCQNCVVRGEAIAAACSYAEKADGKSSSKSNPRSDAEDMRKRINRLESSILQMMSGDGEKSTEGRPSPVHSKSSTSSSEPPDGTGGQKISFDTRSTHWDTILNDLGAMKDAWSEDNDYIEISNGHLTPSSEARRPNLLNGLADLPDRPALMSSLPCKEAADKLVVHFFESYNPAIPAKALIHKPIFLKQYNDHWADPTKSTIMFIGLLFGVMCFSMQSYRRNKEEPPEYRGTSAAVTELYRIRTAQCLGIEDITKPVRLMIQTFYLYALIEYSDERDGDMGSYLLSGTLARLAMQQGYHRDPSQHPNISVYEGEMRRRLWNSVIQHDMLSCVKIGLPKTIRSSECDTAEPRNLYDEELYEDMKELPPSRPITEPTQMSYVITKSRIMREYGRVVDFLHVLEPRPYEDVLRLDASLMEARELIPPHLQVHSLEEMKNDPPSRIMERYIIQLFYHKAICLLHRKYWNSAPTDSIGIDFYSRKQCVASAMVLLHQQDAMHHACIPGGPLVKMKWYHFAITNHDFLLAAMIICLDLMIIQKTSHSESCRSCPVPEIERFDALQRSRIIWSEVIDDCKDAKRAVSILTGVLSKLSIMVEEIRKSIPNQMEAPVSASTPNPNPDSLRFSPYFTDQFRLGIPLIADPPNGGDTVMQDSMLSSGGILETLGSDMYLPADFNWDAWDQFMSTHPQTQPQKQSQPLDQDYPNEFFR